VLALRTLRASVALGGTPRALPMVEEVSAGP